MKKRLAVLAAAALTAAGAQADVVTVTVQGSVVFNGVTVAPLNGVSGGDSVVMSFEVDSNTFVDGIPGDTRGYVIDETSFSMSFGAGPISVGLLNPFPAGQVPYFTLVDGFPVSDGFFVSTSAVSPGGVPISQSPLSVNLDLGYAGTTLSSLDIVDAFGTYDFTGLTRFGFTLWQSFPDNVRMEIDFASMTIAPSPGAMALLGIAGLGARRRR